MPSGGDSSNGSCSSARKTSQPPRSLCDCAEGGSRSGSKMRTGDPMMGWHLLNTYVGARSYEQMPHLRGQPHGGISCRSNAMTASRAVPHGTTSPYTTTSRTRSCSASGTGLRSGTSCTAQQGRGARCATTTTPAARGSARTATKPNGLRPHQSRYGLFLLVEMSGGEQ